MHLNPDGGSPRRLWPAQPPMPPPVPLPPPPPHWQQQQQQSPPPWQQQQQQQPSPWRQQQQREQQGPAPSPGFPPLPPWQAPQGATPSMHDASPAGGSWGTGRSSSIGDFSFHTARESLPRSGSRPAEGGAAGAAAGASGSRWAAAGLPPPPHLPQQQQQQRDLGWQREHPSSGHCPQPQPERQRAQHAPRESPRLHAPQDKQAIMERLKPLLKRRLAEGLLNRETYKLVRCAAVMLPMQAGRGPTQAALPV